MINNQEIINIIKIVEGLPEGKTVIPAQVVVSKQGASVVVDLRIQVNIKRKKLKNN